MNPDQKAIFCYGSKIWVDTLSNLGDVWKISQARPTEIEYGASSRMDDLSKKFRFRWAVNIRGELFRFRHIETKRNYLKIIGLATERAEIEGPERIKKSDLLALLENIEEDEEYCDVSRIKSLLQSVRPSDEINADTLRSFFDSASVAVKGVDRF